MCCLLTGASFLLAVFFAVLLVGHIISGSDGGLALLGCLAQRSCLSFSGGSLGSSKL
jgi:hypothetical protein